MVGDAGTKAAETVTVSAGVLADFDASRKLIGLEVLDARELLGDTLQLEVPLHLES